jgi:hypothetical protein
MFSFDKLCLALFLRRDTHPQAKRSQALEGSQDEVVGNNEGRQSTTQPDDVSVDERSKQMQAQDREEAAIEQYKKVLPKLGFNNALMFELD